MNGGLEISTKREYSKISHNSIELYQPNRLTFATCNSLTLLQSRILITVIKELQEAILFSMNGKNLEMLPLFQGNTGAIQILIQLKEIAHPRQYKEVYESAVKLANSNITLPSSISKDNYYFERLFERVEMPSRINYTSVMIIEINKTACLRLILIDRTANNKPAYFTKYRYAVAMNAKNKYTYKLYMIISSWKQKSGFRILLRDLKLILGIAEDEYIAYCDFKKRVLQPVQKDLEGKADCWFNCSISEFEQRNHQKKVISLNFKIIVPAPNHVIKEKVDYIKYLLRSHFLLNEKDIKILDSFFKSLVTVEMIEQVLIKLQQLQEYINISKRSANPVYNITAYVTKSLLRLF